MDILDAYVMIGNSSSPWQRAENFLRSNLLDIEHRDDLSREQKANRIINLFASVCAGVAIQPIPFADIFVLTPIQVFMGERLAAVWGVSVTNSALNKVVKDILKICGMGLLSQQLAIGAYKTFLPFMGAVTTVPLVYGLTYAMGSVLSEMYKRRAKGEASLTDDQIKSLWKDMMNKGKSSYKKGDEIVPR